MKAARPSCSTYEWCASNTNNTKKQRERERQSSVCYLCNSQFFSSSSFIVIILICVCVSCIQKERGKKKNGAITRGKREMKSKVGEKTSALSSFFFFLFSFAVVVFLRAFFCVLTSTSARSVLSHTSHAHTRFKSLTTSTSTFLSVFLFFVVIVIN